MSEIQNYYEGLRKAAEIPPEYEQEMKDLIDNAGNELSEEERDFQEAWKQFLCNLFLMGMPLSNLLTYLKNNIFDPSGYKCIEKDDSFDRGIKYRPQEIFIILSKLKPEIAYYICGKITDEVGSYEKLFTAIDNQDETLFLNTIRNGNCHITDDVNKLCYYFSNFDSQQFLDDVNEAVEKDTPEDYIEIFIAYLDKVITIIGDDEGIAETYKQIKSLWQEMFKIQEGDFKGATRIMNSLVHDVSTIAKYTYHIFYESEADNTPREQAVLDSITNRPEVAHYFEQWRREFEEESVQEEQDNSKAPKSSGCWIINGTEADTVTWGRIIQQSIWDGIFKQVGQYTFPQKLTAKQTGMRVSQTCAALIYKAAEEVELAKPFLNTEGIGESFNRTIKPIVPYYRRQDMPRYMKMLDVFEKMEHCKKSNNFNRRMRTNNGDNFSDTGLGKMNTSRRNVGDDLYLENPKDLALILHEEDRELGRLLLKNYDKIEDSLTWLRRKIKAKMAK